MTGVTHYWALSNKQAESVLNHFSEPVMIEGDVYKAIYSYPTKQLALLRSGDSSSASSMEALMRTPELYLHKKAGVFKKGSKVRVLCRPDSPNFVMNEFHYTEGWIYRVTLVEEQPKPTDTDRREWR